MSSADDLGLDDGDALLLRALPVDQWAANGVPDPDVVARRRVAVIAVERVLGVGVADGRLRYSPLGPAWSGDLDVHLTTAPDPAVLLSAGWLPLDDLLGRIGRTGHGRWLVRGRDRSPLAVVDVDLGAPPDPLARTLARAERLGKARLREVLELRSLQRAGRALPVDDAVIGAAAAVEAWLGGTDLRAAVTVAAEPRVPPLAIDGGPRRRRIGPSRPRALRRRVVVALSGVDGSGKSTLAEAFARELRAVGIPVDRVWARPGMRTEILRPFAVAARKVLRHGPEPDMQRVVKGLAVTSPSRRGILGWTWAAIITLAFLVDVWRQHLATGGVVVYDRHALDAEVTLAFVYQGVDLRFHRWLARTCLPRADVAAYLDIDPDTAAARKPNDTFGGNAIRSQLDEYERRLPSWTTPVQRLDGRRPVVDLVADLVEQLLRVEPR